MSRFFRSTVMKVTLAVGLTVAATAGALLGIEGISGAAAKPQAIPAVNHQLCYTATTTSAAPGFKIPPAGSVELINQFAPKGFVPVIGPLAQNCNPVQKTITLPSGATKVTPITNAAAHLACFHITAPTQPTFEVKVTNQFGTGTLTTGQPKLLCLPTWKSLTGPPVEPTPQPKTLSHFTCYPVSYVPGTAPFVAPGAVSLRDEFTPATAPPTPVTVGAPKLLCLPTEKVITVNGATVKYKIVNATTHLLCFSVTKTPIRTPVYDLNQFGSATVNIVQTHLLCLPSTKTVL